MIAIIGSGISGLVMALELQQKGLDYILLEAANRPGGNINTIKKDGYTLECGPSTIMLDEELKKYFSDHSLDELLLDPDKISKKRYVVRNGKIAPLPSGPGSLLFGNFLSTSDKIAILKELFNKSTSEKNETVSHFFRRRFNDDITDYVVSPFVSGIFAGDPEKLLLRKSFPFLQMMEKKHSSVIKGFMKGKGSRKQTFGIKGGMINLAYALASILSHCHYNSKVTSVLKMDDYFEVTYKDEFENNKKVYADKIVSCVPAFILADLIKTSYPNESAKLEKVYYPPIAKVFLGYKISGLDSKFAGYGVLNPAKEKLASLGILFSSSVFHETAPDGSHLLTIIFGGSINPEAALLNEKDLIEKAKCDVLKLFHIQQEPDFTYVYSMKKSLPQFDSDIIAADEAIAVLENEGLIVNANWRDGASLSDCLKKGIRLAEKIHASSLVGSEIII